MKAHWSTCCHGSRGSQEGLPQARKGSLRASPRLILGGQAECRGGLQGADRVLARSEADTRLAEGGSKGCALVVPPCALALDR